MYFPKAGVTNPAPGELRSWRFQLQPQTHLNQLIKVFKG